MDDYKIKENCYRDLTEFRQIMSNKNSTVEQFDEIEKKLATMFMNCPSEIEVLVSAVADEYRFRRAYFEIVIWEQ